MGLYDEESAGEHARAAARSARELRNIRLQSHGDAEQDHLKADAILCILLEELGHPEVANEFRLITKWYS